MDLIIDTDPGMGTVNSDPEDSFAITFAANSPEAILKTVTVVQGNVPLRHGYANAKHLLKLLGRDDVTLAAGAAVPLAGCTRRREVLRWLNEKDVRERLFPAVDAPYPGPNAVEAIRDTLTNSDDVCIVAIGPLTNLAATLLLYPELKPKIQRLVIMGGVFFEGGNVTPSAEFNFWMDPEAAQVVLDAGLRPLLVGLDVCHRTHLTREDIDAHQRGTELGAFVRTACSEWLSTMEGEGLAGLHLFDSLSVAAAVHPEILTTEPAWVEIETSGDWTAGASIGWLPARHASWSRPTPRVNADVAVDLDLEKFKRLFQQRVLSQL